MSRSRRRVIPLSSSSPSRLVYEEYIFADVRKRHDLAFSWLYQEYVYANGYLNILDPNRRRDFTKYDDTLCRLLEYLQEKPDQRDGLFSRLLTSAPLITEKALLVLKRYCQDEVNRLSFLSFFFFLTFVV